MRRHPSTVAIVMLAIAAALGGCAARQPYYFRNNGELEHYLDQAATINNVNISEQPNSDVDNSLQPFSISRPAPRSCGICRWKRR